MSLEALDLFESDTHSVGEALTHTHTYRADCLGSVQTVSGTSDFRFQEGNVLEPVSRYDFCEFSLSQKLIKTCLNQFPL